MRAAGGWWKALALLACLAAPWLLYLGVSGDRAGSLGTFLVAAYGVPHTTVYVFLLWLFGRTLVAGGEALVTSVARRVHGTLEPEIEIYTRRVTMAWCVFFGGQLTLSALLFAFASREAWSLFVGAFNIPLLALMFACEYLYRITRYPAHPRASVARTLRAFARGASRPAGPRARQGEVWPAWL